MPPKNVLLLVADDLGKQLGCYGATTCQTPHLDALARSGTLFTRAFASTASCSASRSTIYTGLHTHQNGQYGLAGERHHFTTFGDVATAPKLLKGRGYLTAIVGKVHVGPAEVYPWEVRVESDTRDVGWVAERVGEVFEMAKGKGGGQEEGRPFFLTVGFIDPHRDRTRAGFGNRGDTKEQPAVFSPEVEAARRTYDPADVEVPSFLSDLPGVRTEFASYYEAISRMDLGVGLVLEQLQKSGLAEDTLVLFLSDNGPPFLNSKTTLYDAGVCLPLLVRVPGEKEGVVNPNMVSYVDILPTILDYTSAAGGQNVSGEAEQDTRRLGRSFLRVLSAEHIVADKDWAQEVYGSHTFHEITNYWPTRFVRTARFKYHRNIAWRLDFPFAADIYGSLTWEDIRDAERNPAKTVGSRPLRDYFFRPAEELYDLEADPLEVKNLAVQEGGGGESEYAQVLGELREKLEAWQYRTLDPWLYRDGISVLFVKHHLEAGMQMPDRWDLDAENTGSRGDGGLAAFQQRAWGTDRVQE